MSGDSQRNSQTRPLEEVKPEPALMNVAKFVFKLTSGLILLFLLVVGEFCDSEVNDSVKASCILLLVEAFFMVFYLLSKYKSTACVSCSSTYLLTYVIIDFLLDIFYIIWSIYYCVIFFRDGSCSDESATLRTAEIFTLAYFLFTTTLVICCCASKTCFIVTVVSASSNTKKGTLSDNLLNEKIN